MSVKFSTDDLKTAESLERVLRQFQQAMEALRPAKAPKIDLNTLATQLAPLIQPQLQAGGVAPLNLQSLLPSTNGGVILQDTHANRLSIYQPTSYPVGTLFFETDRTVLYMASTSAGASVWKYIDGTSYQALGSLPADLTLNDNDFLAYTTDYGHVHRWNGGAWVWGPGDPGSDFYQLYENAPAGFPSSAWALVDGSTVNRSNADGTLTSVTLDNLATAAYLKGGTSSAAVAASSGRTTSDSAGTPAGSVSSGFTGSPSNTGGPSATTTVDNTGAGSTVSVASSGHIHTDTASGSVSSTFTGSPMAGHDHGPNTLELRRLQKLLYYRR